VGHGGACFGLQHTKKDVGVPGDSPVRLPRESQREEGEKTRRSATPLVTRLAASRRVRGDTNVSGTTPSQQPFLLEGKTKSEASALSREQVISKLADWWFRNEPPGTCNFRN